jgi:Tfp pilus assembly PilM family ATPase/Tfp pilus assembly protein PilN
MNITTLYISARAVKAISTHGTALNKQETVLPAGSIKNGLVLQPDVTGGEIKSLFRAGKLSTGRVICAVNGLPFSYRLLTVPRMEPAAFHEAVLRTAKKEMSISPDEMYLSWQAYPADNDEWQVLVAGITRHPIDNLIKTLTSAGISPWLMDLPHLALARLSPYKDAIIVDFEKDCSNIVMMVDGVPRGLHMVPALPAGASLMDQLAQVTDKMAKMIEFYNGSHPAKPIKEPARILVTGDLLDDVSAFSSIQTQVGYPVEQLDTAKKFPAGWPVFSYSVNAGLMDVRMDTDNGKDTSPYHYLDLENIVKERRPKTDVLKVLKKSLVPAAIIAALALLATSYLSQQKIQENIAQLSTQYNGVNAELVQKQAAAKQADLLQGQIDNISAQIKAIESGKLEIFSSREYVDDITAIVACMPEGINFDALEITSTNIVLQGTTDDASTVVKFAGNLENTGGYSRADIEWIQAPHAVIDGRMESDFKITIIKIQGNTP